MHRNHALALTATVAVGVLVAPEPWALLPLLLILLTVLFAEPWVSWVEARGRDSFKDLKDVEHADRAA